MPENQRKARTDLRGIVRVTITLESPNGERTKGNIVKTFRVAGVSVSQAADAMLRVFTRPEPVYQLKA
jgi:hypothetical protein